jgi:hypothetical protein
MIEQQKAPNWIFRITFIAMSFALASCVTSRTNAPNENPETGSEISEAGDEPKSEVLGPARTEKKQIALLVDCQMAHGYAVNGILSALRKENVEWNHVASAGTGTLFFFARLMSETWPKYIWEIENLREKSFEESGFRFGMGKAKKPWQDWLKKKAASKPPSSNRILVLDHWSASVSQSRPIQELVEQTTEKESDPDCNGAPGIGAIRSEFPGHTLLGVSCGPSKCAPWGDLDFSVQLDSALSEFPKDHFQNRIQIQFKAEQLMRRELATWKDKIQF